VKLGLFAKILLVFKKIWILIIVGIGGLLKKIAGIFKKKPENVNEISLNSEEMVYKDNPEVDTISEIASTSIDSQNEDNEKS